MKLNCKRIDFTYTPGEEIFTFPDESGLPFLFDVEKELTGDPTAMDAVGEMLDEAEKLAEKAKAAIKAALADEDSRYHGVFREPTRPSCPLPRWWTFCGLIALAAWWITRWINKFSLWICPSTRRSPTS